jgi:hypothetical protein
MPVVDRPGGPGRSLEAGPSLEVGLLIPVPGPALTGQGQETMAFADEAVGS